jgi:UDP-N-acetylglucosamine 4,6-dehydratase/5-epimerase
MFNKKTILITGGSGSWGQELTKQLLMKYSPKEIRIYSRGEPKQVSMNRYFKNNKRLKFIIGDVRDVERLEQATQGVDYLFHLAALKHVPVCEQNVEEAVKTNILGIKNVIGAAIKNSIKKVIQISTDKAVSPLNFYGLSKSVGEKLIIAANTLESKTSFVCIRAGNALGTSESVVPLFRDQILSTNKITVTNGEMTRFFFNLKQAISLVFRAAIDSVGGEIFVMEMPAMKIDDLADVFMGELGTSSAKKIIIGERPGEKKHELLVSEDESKRTFKLGEYFLILPMIEIAKIKKKYNIKKLVRIPFGEVSSKDAKRLNYKGIKAMLDNENWLAKDQMNGDLIHKNKKYLLDFFKNEGWIKGRSL